MRIVQPSAELINPIPYDTALSTIIIAARTCYQSYDKSTPESDMALIRSCIKRGHESVLEHVSITAKLTTDRAIANELVRHRLCAFSQESTRYVKYDDGIEVIQPADLQGEAITDWQNEVIIADLKYRKMVKNNNSPQTARAVLPLCLKTTLVMTTNIREWRHIFKLRLDKAAHPDCRRLMGMLFEQMKGMYPVFFEDIEVS